MSMVGREDMARLLRVRDDFVRRYDDPTGRFVSLGFSVQGGEPCLNVRIDKRSARRWLPPRFDGVMVRVHESEAGVLALGQAPEPIDN
jgi:hypothetical protein